MKARVGDRIVCQGNAVGVPERTGEVRRTGPGGQPPFQVRWSDGHETVFRPGPDAVIQPKPSKPSSSRR